MLPRVPTIGVHFLGWAGCDSLDEQRLTRAPIVGTLERYINLPYSILTKRLRSATLIVVALYRSYF